MSSTYTISDVQEADALYDRMSLQEVSGQTGIPYGTLSSWSRKGWISTDANHYTGPKRYSEDTVERADALWDRMPITDVSEVLDVPVQTLQGWKARGWISTDVDWKSRARAGERKASVVQAVELVRVKGLTYEEVADELGVSKTTIYRYLRDYKTESYRHD